jgi:hypothetical protein
MDPYKHPKWQKKRLKILERDEWSCVACGDADSTLHVHHAYYEGDPWDVEDKFLQTLCEKCHSYLGEHPKGGVWWIKGDSPDLSSVFVHWCPICKSQEFRDKGGSIRCRSCGWVCTYSHIDTSPSLVFDDVVTEKKRKPYSISWLKGIVARVRSQGAADCELFDAIFPNYAARQQFDEMRSAVATLADAIKTQRLPVDVECEVLCAIVKARRAVQAKLGGE